jgi:hypothetical protein
MRDAVPAAIPYCVPVAEGFMSVLAGTALPMAGLALTVAGGLTAAVTGPFCAMSVTRIVIDYRIYKDPPLAGMMIIARPAPVAPVNLPSCTHWPKAAAFCLSLRGALTAFATATEQIVSVDTALATTMGRDTAARAQHNATAQKLQDGALQSLGRRLATAVSAQQRTGAQVAALLRANHLQWVIPQAQTQKGIDAIFARSAALGVTRAQIERASGNVIALPLDALAMLSNPTALLVADIAQPATPPTAPSPTPAAG